MRNPRYAIPVRLSFLVFCSALGHGAGQARAAAETPSASADNSAVNQRDREDEALTAERQVRGSRSDVELTRLIRRELTKRDDLSVYAHNVKIITVHGVATLRGPVRTEAEKARVAALARRIVGAQQVRNELEVSKQ
jgi:hyperosmotically inducible protein